MKLAEKIVKLRKQKGYSQEELAEKLNVSRQAVSRWEMDTALPEATNIIQLSRLFGVSTDYLLFEEYENEKDVPKNKMQKEFFVLFFLQIICFLFHIVSCIFLNGMPLLVIVSLVMNIYLTAKISYNLESYNFENQKIKKYYVYIYIIIIWLMACASLERLVAMIFNLSRFGVFVTVVLYCVIPAIITIQIIKKKDKEK